MTSPRPPVPRRRRCLRRDERGATAVEYGLILALIVMVMFVGLTTLGRQTGAMWNYVATSVINAR